MVIIKEWCLRLERVTNLNLEEIHGWGKTPFLKAFGASATLLWTKGFGGRMCRDDTTPQGLGFGGVLAWSGFILMTEDMCRRKEEREGRWKKDKKKRNLQLNGNLWKHTKDYSLFTVIGFNGNSTLISSIYETLTVMLNVIFSYTTANAGT